MIRVFRGVACASLCRIHGRDRILRHANNFREALWMLRCEIFRHLRMGASRPVTVSEKVDVMNSESTPASTNAQTRQVVSPPAPQGRRPVYPLAITVLACLAIVLSHRYVSEIEDAIHLGLDVIMMATLAAAIGLLLMWLIWFLFRSRWRWRTRLIASVLLLLLPVMFFRVFRPIHGGDTNVVRFEPVWTEKTKPIFETSVAEAEPQIDLLTETTADFPRFLGADQVGRVNAELNTDDLSGQTRVVWKQPVGEGWSGFVSRNGYAVTMEQRGGQECVTCYEVATGQLQWVYESSARHLDTMKLGRIGPRSTPTIHRGLVYAVGAVGNLVCLNGNDGTVVWQQDLNETLGITLGESADSDGMMTQYESNTTLAWGRSGAPLIVDDTVVICGGGPAGPKRATLLAFDLASGALRWKGGSEMIAYGSPILADIAGTRQILLTAETQVMGFEPDTGKVLWTFSRPGQSDGAANTSQVLPISETDILVSKGYPDGGGDRIHLEQKDGVWTASSVWNSSRVLKTKLTSPVIHEDHAYCISNGFMECVRLSDGEQKWKRRGRFGHGQLLLVGKILLVHSEEGELFLLDANPNEYRELAVNRTISGVCWNNLCLAGKYLLVRSELEAACLELPMKPLTSLAENP